MSSKKCAYVVKDGLIAGKKAKILFWHDFSGRRICTRDLVARDFLPPDIEIKKGYDSARIINGKEIPEHYTIGNRKIVLDSFCSLEICFHAIDRYWKKTVTTYGKHLFWIVDRDILNLGVLLKDDRLSNKYVDAAIGYIGMSMFFVAVMDNDVVFLSGSWGEVINSYYSHIVVENIIRRLGFDPCDFYRKKLHGLLDEKILARYHELLFKEYYSEALRAENEHDFMRAAELYESTIWILLKMINKKRKFTSPHFICDTDCQWKIISAISDETKDNSIKILFELAKDLDLYYKFEKMPPDRYRIYSDAAKTLIEKLREYLEKIT